MSDVLQGEARDLSFSKGELNKFRKDGRIPAVIYGKGMDSVPCFVNLLDFRNLYQKKGKIFEVKVGSSTELVNTKTIDTTNLGKITHINFHKLTRGEKTTVKVPVTLEGESKGAKAGGILQQLEDVVMVTGVPKDIPESLKIDVTELEIGSSITAAQLTLPKGIELDTDAEKTIVTCSAPQKQEEEAPAAEGEEAAEGEAPAEGDAPAGDTPAESSES